MPEPQFVGALEREAEALRARVDGALAEAERGRDLRSRADELVERLRGRPTRGAGGRRRPKSGRGGPRGR